MSSSAGRLKRTFGKIYVYCRAGGVTTLFQQPVGPILETAGGRSTAKRLFAEIGAIFKAAGIPKDPGLEEESYRTLTSMSYHMKSSMLRDMEKGRVTEGDHLHGFCLRKRKACQLIHLFWKPSAPTCKCMKRIKRRPDRLLLKCPVSVSEDRFSFPVRGNTVDIHVFGTDHKIYVCNAFI